MKVIALVISHIGLIKSESIPFNQPLLLFYGQVKQGKTIILNAVRWAFGGEYPQDILTHDADKGYIQLHFENGYLKRDFYRAENGEVKSRPLTLILDDEKVARPVEKLKALLNPFLLDQNYLVNMTEFYRKKYFAEVFETSTPALDAEFSKCNTEAAELRIKVKSYGDIAPVKVERVEVSSLRAKLQAVQTENRLRVDGHAMACGGVLAHNNQRKEAE